MRRVLFGGVLAISGFALLATGVPARALVIAPPPGPMRAAKAEVIVVGRIVALEEKDVSAPQFPKATQNVNYRIAVVSVTEAVKGAKGLKTIRLGFIPPPQPNKGRPFIRPGIRFNVNFTVGQDGMFFLTKHHKENFYTAPMYFDFVNSQTPNFAKEVQQAKLAVKIGNNPQAALKSKDKEERFFAAAMLIDKYRPFLGGKVKTEAIDAAESKLILTALLDADWKQGPGFGQFHPYSLFNRLGPKDGWIQPQGNINVIYDAAKEWLQKNAGTYRIERIVGSTTGPNSGPGPIRPILPPVKIQPKN
jgi:hypothetical protein